MRRRGWRQQAPRPWPPPRRVRCREKHEGEASSSAQGDDWSRLPRSGARKAQLRTQGGGDSRNFSTQQFVGVQSCLLLPLTAPSRVWLSRTASSAQAWITAWGDLSYHPCPAGGRVPVVSRREAWPESFACRRTGCTPWGGRTFKVSRSQR